MGLLSWILFGLIVGGIAKFLMPGKDPGGCLVTILLGIAGALLGGFLATELLGWGGITGFDLRSLAIAVAGAILILGAYRLAVGRKRR
ncbi:MAG TPA: GlsB/YeaQ/YmgE family stress response membrane protein [Longimicrobiales bacterium]